MGKRLFVGNLAKTVTDATLAEVFSTQGTVRSAQVVVDPKTGEPRGTGLVEMGSDEEARAAVKALDLKEVEGRCITVQFDRPRTGGARIRRRG